MPPPQEDQPVILSDAGIRARIDSGAIRLDPYDPALVQPASIDFRLHQDILVFNNYTCEAIDPYAVPEDLHSKVTITDENPFILHPGDFVLASSMERLTVPVDLVARCEGKSSLGRLGLAVHVTAGYVDPGWSDGHITLELANVSRLPIKLWAGMRIGQFAFETLDQPAERPYGHPALGSKYQGQSGPVASRCSGNARPTALVG